MLKLKKGHFALAAGIFATMIWGSQPFVGVRVSSELNFLEVVLLLHAFALAGVVALNAFRLGDFLKDVRFMAGVKPAVGFWLLSGACQSVCFLFLHLSVQNGPEISGAIMHFMWPFVFAVSNALFPSTWDQRSSGYEMKVVLLGIVGVWFLVIGGLSVGELSNIGLGKLPLMFAGLVSAIFGCCNAVCDYHALARSRARRVELLQAPDLPVSFRYSALFFRFLAGLATTLVLWAAQPYVPALPPVDFSHVSAGAWLAPLWLGLVVYFGADFFFGYTMTHVSESARQGFTYLPPLFAAIFLYFGGAHIDEEIVFGMLIILFSMFQMQAGTRGWTANTAAPLLFIFSSIIVLYVPGVLKRADLIGDGQSNGGIGAEVMASVFAIVISFLLSRLLDRNKSENMKQIENAALMGEVVTETARAAGEGAAADKVRNLAYQLSVYTLDFDVNTQDSRREGLVQKINAAAHGMNKAIEDAVPQPSRDLKEQVEELGRGILEWIYLRSQFLSLAEKWSVALLSFSSIVAFLIATNRSPDWYADLSAIALITTIFILVFQTFDLGANRSDTEVEDLLNKQMPLLRHGFLPYVPYEVIKRRIFAAEGRPKAVLTRRPEGPYEHVNIPAREKDLVFLERLLSAAGLAAVILLLMDKHGLVTLF